MLCKPKPYYDEKKKVAIGYKSPLYLSRAKQVQPALYNGHELVKTNHTRVVVHDSEDTLDIVEKTRIGMLEKMKSTLWVDSKINITPPDYSKENYLATFTRQRQLTPEQIFWSSDLEEITPKPILKMTVKFWKQEIKTSLEVLAFDSVFVIGKLKEQLQGRGNTIRELKEKKSQMKEKHSKPDLSLAFKALDSQNKELTKHITRAKTIEKTTSLLTKIENLKAQIKGKMKCVTMDTVKPKVLAPEEARSKNPLDNALHSAYVYTKRSQKLLEYVIDTCPKEFSKRDKKVAIVPLTRKKQVTLNETCETLTNNTQKHVKQQKMQKTNVPVIPSTGVNSSTKASGSKPKSNTKKNMVLSAKSDNKMKVKDHPRNNKSSLKKANRVDSIISSKHAVINSNSKVVCKTCNKCLIYANHDMCVVKYLNSANASPTVKKKFTLGEECPLTRLTQSKVVHLQQHENVSTSENVITEILSNTSQKPLTRYKLRNKQDKAISTSIPTTDKTQTFDAFVKYTDVSANQPDPNRN
ncbi:hypothetical protein Tco_0719815 [Tanacetum coccineum]